MVRRQIMLLCLIAATVLSSDPQLAAADEQQKKADTAESKKDGKETKGESETENFREGINRAYEEFKKETSQGVKNLNDLYQRSTSTSKDEKAK